MGTPRYDSEWPDAKAIQVECEMMGVSVPVECKPDADLGTYGAMLWTKNP